jgi:hypothetical protein
MEAERDRKKTFWQKAEVALYRACFSQKTPAGRMCRNFILALILLNILAVLLESVPAVNTALGGASAHESAIAFQRFEAVSGNP